MQEYAYTSTMPYGRCETSITLCMKHNIIPTTVKGIGILPSVRNGRKWKLPVSLFGTQIISVRLNYIHWDDESQTDMNFDVDCGDISTEEAKTIIDNALSTTYNHDIFITLYKSHELVKDDFATRTALFDGRSFLV